MQNKISTKKIIIIFFSVIATTIFLLGGIFFLISGSSNSSDNKAQYSTVDSSGMQVIAITAKIGYLPKLSIAQANKPITLRVNTKSTYDCSSGIRIPSLNITKQLPSDGVTDIEIPAQTAGTIVDFTCSMGMYSGQIKIS